MDIAEEIRQNPESGARRLESEYKAGLMNLALRFCHDSGDAEELVNRTFAAVVDGIDGYLEQSAFFAWMCQILTNLHSNDNRRKERQGVVCTGVVPDVPDEASDGEAYRVLDASLLRDAIETLPPDIRKTLLLHYFMDMPVKEVARVLSSPTSTITWRLHYARKILAAKLGVAAFRPGWAACALRADWTDFSPERPFEVVSGATALFGGRASWTAQPDGTVKGVITLAARAAADMQCVALEAKVENLPVFPLGSGHEADLDLPAGGGRTLTSISAAPSHGSRRTRGSGAASGTSASATP